MHHVETCQNKLSLIKTSAARDRGKLDLTQLPESVESATHSPEPPRITMKRFSAAASQNEPKLFGIAIG